MIYLNIVYEKILGKSFDLLGPGGTPHECLTVGANQIHYLAYLRLKTHVQHTISFIQHLGKETTKKLSNFIENKSTLTKAVAYQVRTTVHVGLSSLQEIDKSTRSCDTYLTAIQVSELRCFRSSSIDTGRTETTASFKGLSHLVYLLSKLSCRGQHKYLQMNGK